MLLTEKSVFLEKGHSLLCFTGACRLLDCISVDTAWEKEGEKEKDCLWDEDVIWKLYQPLEIASLDKEHGKGE